MKIPIGQRNGESHGVELAVVGQPPDSFLLATADRGIVT